MIYKNIKTNLGILYLLKLINLEIKNRNFNKHWIYY